MTPDRRSSTASTDAEPPSTIRANATWQPLALVLLGWCGIAAMASFSYQSMPADIELTADHPFVASQAMQHLRRLLGNHRPHPAGSAESQRIRDSIAAHLAECGLEVQEQSGIGLVDPKVKDRSPNDDRLPLTNLIAGRNLKPTAQKKLLLVAHYDSVPFGPGASDNGVGVAALMEIARLLKDRELHREIVFLFSDGEEMGLLGAKLFLEQHALASEIGLVINLDARGTTGPSLMFETSESTGDLIPMFAQASRHPYASSLFYEVYKRLPRDTDFSVFKRAKVEGFNFAFIGNARDYHTPADNLDRVSELSLQHHGTNVLGLIEVIETSQKADRFLQRPTDGTPPATQSARLVYFDFFGQGLIRWSEMTAKIVSIGTLLVWLGLVSWLLGCCQLGVQSSEPSRAQHDQSGSRWIEDGGPLTLRSGLKHAARIFCLGSLIGLTVWLVLVLAKLDVAFSLSWPDNPTPLLLGLWGTGLAVALGIMAKSPTRDETTNTGGSLGANNPFQSMVIMVGIWTTLACVVTFLIPGASFLFQIPATGGLLVLLGLVILGRLTSLSSSAAHVQRKGQMLSVGCVLLAWLTGLIWLPLEPLFYDAVGTKIPVMIAVRLSLVTLSSIPAIVLMSLVQRFRGAMLLTGLSVISVAVARFF